MIRTISRRLAKIEARRRKKVQVPNVLFFQVGEGIEAAKARFAAKYGHAIPKGRKHPVLFVPQFASLAEFASAFKKQQTELLANAKTIKSNDNSKGGTNE